MLIILASLFWMSVTTASLATVGAGVIWVMTWLDVRANRVDQLS